MFAVPIRLLRLPLSPVNKFYVEIDNTKTLLWYNTNLVKNLIDETLVENI